MTATSRKQSVGRKLGPPVAHHLQLLNVPRPFKTAPPARDHVTNTNAYGNPSQNVFKA